MDSFPYYSTGPRMKPALDLPPHRHGSMVPPRLPPNPSLAPSRSKVSKARSFSLSPYGTSLHLGSATRAPSEEESLSAELNQRINKSDQDVNRHFALSTFCAIILCAILAVAIAAPMFVVDYMLESKGYLAFIHTFQMKREEIQKATRWTPCSKSKYENRARCHNAGICLTDAFTGVKKCVCDDGVTGALCQSLTPRHPWDSNCQNGGICRKSIGRDFYCECPLGYEGKTCNKKISPCDSNPCDNGGTCHDRRWTHVCECTFDKAGEFCERNASLCPTSAPPPNTCARGGICTNLFGGLTYTCSNCVVSVDEHCVLGMESIAGFCEGEGELGYLFGQNPLDGGRCFTEDKKLFVGVPKGRR